jgi:hypothetical protein
VLDPGINSIADRSEMAVLHSERRHGTEQLGCSHRGGALCMLLVLSAGMGLRGFQTTGTMTPIRRSRHGRWALVLDLLVFGNSLFRAHR